MHELKIKRILFATDFLENSRLALDYAVAFAHHFKATVVLLHALELSSPAEEAELMTSRPSLSRMAATERLDALAAGLRRTGLDVEEIIEAGTPCQVILSQVRAHPPDLLVLGVHGVHRGVEHLLIGSNTEKILLAVNCPTLSIGSHVPAGVDLSLQLKDILYCSDFTPEAAVAAPYARMLGREFHVPVEVCHIPSPPSEQDTGSAEEYCDALRSTMPEVTDPWCTSDFHLNQTVDLNQILGRTEAEPERLIVLGVHTDSQLGRHLHTSFAYQLLTRAACPVLSIRAVGSNN